MAELHKKILQDLLQVKNVDCGLRGGEMLLDQFPMITLNNGVTVCNFSSNHSYKFDTGETLPACLKVTADRHKLSIIETKIPRWKGHDASDSNKYEKWEFEHHNLNENKPDWYDIELTRHSLLSHTKKDLEVLAKMNKLDIILVPFVVKSILNDQWKTDAVIYKISKKARTCRKIDPRDNSQGIYSSKFCM